MSASVLACVNGAYNRDGNIIVYVRIVGVCGGYAVGWGQNGVVVPWVAIVIGGVGDGHATVANPCIATRL